MENGGVPEKEEGEGTKQGRKNMKNTCMKKCSFPRTEKQNHYN